MKDEKRNIVFRKLVDFYLFLYEKGKDEKSECDEVTITDENGKHTVTPENYLNHYLWKEEGYEDLKNFVFGLWHGNRGKVSQDRISRKYEGLIFTYGNPKIVLDHSQDTMATQREIWTRIRNESDPEEPFDTLSIERKDINERLESLMSLETDRQELDGALIIDGQGKIQLKYGSIELDPDTELAKRLTRKGRKPTGTGERASMRTSALGVTNSKVKVWTYKISTDNEEFPVVEYGAANPVRRLRVGPREKSEDIIEIALYRGGKEIDSVPIKNYDWSLHPPSAF